MSFCFLLALAFFLTIPCLLGLILSLSFRRARPVGVLLFHRISKKIPLSISSVSVRQFERFCEEITLSGKKAVGFSDFNNTVEQVCICFDDGHRSVFDFAYPLLKKHGITATVFVASGILSGEKVEDFYETKNMMTAKNLLELAENGWEIASHGVRHLDLTLLSDEDLNYELRCSKAEIEKLLAPVAALSVPYGAWNKKVVDFAKKCGYTKFSVYRGHSRADGKEVIAATAVFEFDSKEDIKRKIEGKIRGLTYFTSFIVPHFAKGTPVFFGSKFYNWKKLRLL